MRRERFDKINVVPFIDIVLVLLVIVLATATFATKKMVKVDLPTASSKKISEKKSISISIDAKGDYFYEKNPLALKELEDRLKKLDPKKDVISLQTDQKTEFQKFVSIIDILKEKGFENLSIITK
ncbi:Biopolymer transport protein ExbD/TolR [hydrothermal vent metagenome]|uniref:Biopolymer transport protein ExbD/TolR n=1 Tax=hydrothermal vent metagenome TaxID=652676 RepID=A0A1W1CFZ6_9ZZZZ